ncbi:MAG: carboxypeptidase-like regulatory domain-containing protein [Bacteroidota bacterium]
MKLNLTVLLVFFSTLFFAQKTTVSGVVSDKDLNNEALAFANVTIKGTSLGATTNIEGKYAIEVPAGTHIIVFSFLGYESKEVSFTITEGENKIINETLGSGSVSLQDVVVKATGSREKETALLLEQKKAVEIKQSIGAQEMSRKGVSDVEEGLTKITGIAKVDGRGLFVRGLEDRYNNLLINDLQAPSNSPFKKIIPTDLFPTDIVGVLNVYKTFNPNISGDFAGATINIETSQPKNNITKITSGFSYVTNNNGEDFLLSEDANTTQGFLGLNGDDKVLPGYFGGKPSGVVMSPNQYSDYSKNSNWNADKSSSPINTSLGFLHANKVKVGDNDLNYIVSVNQDNAYIIRKGVERTFNFGQGNYDNNLFTTSYDFKTTVSGLASMKYKTNRFSVGLNSFLLRATSAKIEDQFGYTNSQANKPNMIIRMNQLEETQYWNNQILGNYDITADKKHTIKGGFSFVKTKFGQPDRKFIVGELNGEDQITANFGGNNLIRQYLDISGDRFFSGMLEYNVKLNTTAEGKDNKLSVGYNGFSNEEISSYRFLFGKPISSSIPQFTTSLNNIEGVISNAVENGIVNFTETSNEDYKSKLYQNIQSGYANLFWNFGEKWEVNGGVRVEKSLREIKFRRLGYGINSNFSKLTNDEIDFLPSVNTKYSVNEKSNLRFAASKTITRPASAELLPIEYLNADGTVVLGNYPLAKTVFQSEANWKSLKNSDNLNFDLKYEIFPKESEMLAVGLFGKQIQNPIERIFVQSASSGGQITTFDNSKSATIFGAELELLLQLKRIVPALDKFTFGFNTSLMKTNVKVDKINNPSENSNTRKLQGAADWVINSDLKYEFEFNEDMKNTVTLVYGVTGDRIYAVGTSGLDHIYEKPFQKLDFVWTSKLSKNLEAKLSIDNILNPNFKRVMGDNSNVTIYENDLTVRQYKKGTGFGLTIGYTF